MTKLKKYRLEKNMTQQEVANFLGVTVRMYQHIEAVTRYPSYKILCKLEDLFEMTHRELLAKSDET